jgi:hypothetical protein
MHLSISSWVILLLNLCVIEIFFQFSEHLKLSITVCGGCIDAQLYVPVKYWSQYFFIIEFFVVNWLLPLLVKKRIIFFCHIDTSYYLYQLIVCFILQSCLPVLSGMVVFNIVNSGNPLNLVKSCCINSSSLSRSNDLYYLIVFFLSASTRDIWLECYKQ